MYLVNNKTPARCSSPVSKQQKSLSIWSGHMFSFTMSNAINTGTDNGYRTFGKASAWKRELMARMVSAGITTQECE